VNFVKIGSVTPTVCISRPIWLKLCIANPTCRHWVNISFMDVGVVKAVLYSGEETNFCLYFRFIWGKFGTKDPHVMLLNICDFPKKGAGKAICGPKRNYMHACAVKECDIWKAKSSLVKSVYNVRECPVSSCVCLLRGSKWFFRCNLGWCLSLKV
jgi:hypothetical protein